MRDRLLAECARLEEFAGVNAATHFTQAKMLGRFFVWLDILPAAVIAGLGGIAIAFPDQLGNEAFARTLGVGSVAAAAIATFYLKWSPDRRRVEHQMVAIQYKNLENRARRVREIYAESYDDQALVIRVEALTLAYDDLNYHAPLASDGAFDRALEEWRSGRYRADPPRSG